MFEYVIKREDRQIMIVVNMVFSYFDPPRFIIEDIKTKEKGKRKWISVAAYERDNYQYRHTDYDKRGEYAKNIFLNYCSEDEIKAAVDNYIESFRPKKEEIEYRIG